MYAENCFSCATKSTIWFTSFCGIPRFYIECQHRSDGPQIKIIKSKFHMTIWFILMMFASALSCWYIKLLLKFDKQDIAPWIFNFINMINAVRALSVLILSFNNSKYYENLYVIVDAALQDWKSKMYRPLLQRQDYYIDAICSIMCVGWLIFVVFYAMIRIQTNMTIAKMIDIIAPGIVHADIMLCLTFILFLILTTKVAQNCQNVVMEKLATRMACTKLGNKNKKAAKGLIIKLLRDFRAVHEMRCKLFKQGNQYYNPTLLIYGILATILPISCTLGVIYGPKSKDYTIDNIWEVPAMLLGVIIMMAILLVLYENGKIVVSFDLIK